MERKSLDSDDELFATARAELFSAVVGDILDKLGLLHQFLPPQIRPLHDNMIVIGRAMPVIVADINDTDSFDGSSPINKPFGLMLEALDDLQQNEVYVCSGGSLAYALWGELMSTRARYVGATGAVLNGFSRDSQAIIAMGFPTFSLGPYAQDQAPRGKVIDFRVPLQIGDVRIEPRDIIFGDYDGICVIPQQVQNEVFERALEKARGEKVVKTALETGMSAAAAFAHYGIL
jgi:regulator of RNase E activity RraA